MSEERRPNRPLSWDAMEQNLLTYAETGILKDSHHPVFRFSPPILATMEYHWPSAEFLNSSGIRDRYARPPRMFVLVKESDPPAITIHFEDYPPNADQVIGLLYPWPSDSVPPRELLAPLFTHQQLLVGFTTPYRHMLFLRTPQTEYINISTLLSPPPVSLDYAAYNSWGCAVYEARRRTGIFQRKT